MAKLHHAWSPEACRFPAQALTSLCATLSSAHLRRARPPAKAGSVASPMRCAQRFLYAYAFCRTYPEILFLGDDFDIPRKSKISGMRSSVYVLPPFCLSFQAFLCIFTVLRLSAVLIAAPYFAVLHPLRRGADCSAARSPSESASLRVMEPSLRSRSIALRSDAIHPAFRPTRNQQGKPCQQTITVCGLRALPLCAAYLIKSAP